MDFFDNHCDTLSRILDEKEDLADATGHISLDKGAFLSRWGQVFALFVDDSAGREGPYARYLDERACMKRQFAQNADRLLQCRTAADLDRAFRENKCAAILSVENGAALEGRLDHLLQFAQDGVKLLTLTWFGENELGYGSAVGGRLKPFGREVLAALPQYGIVPDISHLSDQGVEDVFGCWDGPLAASHSDVRSVTPHFRNLTDAQVREIVRRGGIIGINFFGPFLRASGEASIDDVYRHLDAFLALGAQKTVCFGSDFDGVGRDLPADIGDLGGVARIWEYLLARGIPETVLRDVFFENAFFFWKRQLGEETI